MPPLFVVPFTCTSAKQLLIRILVALLDMRPTIPPTSDPPIMPWAVVFRMRFLMTAFVPTQEKSQPM